MEGWFYYLDFLNWGWTAIQKLQGDFVIKWFLSRTFQKRLNLCRRTTWRVPMWRSTAAHLL